MVIAAAISDVRIANMALSNLGAEHMESFTERSTSAIQAQLWYEFSLLQSLEAADWNFARRRVVLNLHGDTIPTASDLAWSGVWGYRYVYPGDCVAMRKIQHPASPPDDALPFEIETNINGKEKTILTNQQFAVAVYTYNTPHADLYSPYFVQMLSHVLAANMALSLTGSMEIKNFHAQVGITMGNVAASQNLNEAVEKPPRDADWIRLRQ